MCRSLRARKAMPGPGVRLGRGLRMRPETTTYPRALDPLDLQLLAFDPSTRRVVLSKQLAGTHYEALSGTSLATPGEQSQRPSQDALERAWLTFVDGEGPD